MNLSTEHTMRCWESIRPDQGRSLPCRSCCRRSSSECWASQPGMIVAGQVRPSERVATAARRVRADLVILRESQEGATGTPWQVLNEDPRLKILAITGDGHRATADVGGGPGGPVRIPGEARAVVARGVIEGAGRLARPAP